MRSANGANGSRQKQRRNWPSSIPNNDDGSMPIAYLWARTILSEAPGEGDTAVEVPLIRSMWLAKRSNRRRALRWVRDSHGNVKTEKVSHQFADGSTKQVRYPLLEGLRTRAARARLNQALRPEEPQHALLPDIPHPSKAFGVNFPPDEVGPQTVVFYALLVFTMSVQDASTVIHRQQTSKRI